MSKTIVVVAPHPDDETLGCGATLLKHVAAGDQVHWLIMTEMSDSAGYTQKQIEDRQIDINKVTQLYDFTEVHQFPFEPAKLDQYSMSEIVGALYPTIQRIKPEVIYLPYRGDVHSDHQVTFDAIAACSKSFRAPFVESILAYETLSETDFNIKPDDSGFRPNVWVDVSDFFAQKLKIMNVYHSELKEFPFPRSIEAMEALAKVRGVQCGALAAEAFMLLKEIKR